MIVLDTNVVIRIMTAKGRLGPSALKQLDQTADRCCSTMMQWELAMLTDKGRLTLTLPVDVWIERARDLLRFVDVAVSGAIARDAGSLPGAIHGDPCDRLMIATARALACPLMTTDDDIVTYAAAGHVQAIDARH